MTDCMYLYEDQAHQYVVKYPENINNHQDENIFPIYRI